MKNQKCKNQFWRHTSFKENRPVFQTSTPASTPEQIGKAILDDFLNKAKAKLTLPQGISSALESAILAIARILKTSGDLIDSSSGLLMSGMDWAKFGFDRLKKRAEREDPPREYLDEYRLVKNYFNEFNGAVTSTGPRSQDQLDIVKNSPEMKKIVDAQMMVYFFNFKLKEVQSFYEPAKREYEKVRDRLNAVRKNQGGKQMEEYGKVEMRIAGIEERLKNSRSKDPSTESAYRKDLLAAKVRRTQLERLLSYNAEWAVPELLSCEFPPNSNPKQFLPRFEPNATKTMKLFLPDLVEALGGQFENMGPLVEKYADEAKRQAYVRDEHVRIMVERMLKEGKKEPFITSALTMISEESARLDSEYQTALGTVHFSRERDPANPKVNLPPLILVNPVVDPSAPVPPLRSNEDKPI